MKGFSAATAAIALFCLLGGRAAGATDHIAVAGDIGEIALPTAGLITTLACRDREGTKEFVESGSVALATNESLKYTVHERRPNGSQHSFPSGHTVSAFMGATFLQQRYGWAAGIPAYLVASFVGYSRVESKNHYWHDVYAGAAIGIASSLLFTTPYQGLAAVPVVGKGFAGIVIGKRF